MTKHKPQLLIFDLDDTLVPGEFIYAEALAKLGITSDDPIFLKARAEVKNLLPAFAPAARSRYLYFKKYLELKNDYSPSKANTIAENYETEVVRLMTLSWNQLNRTSLFKQLRRLNKSIAVITNESCRFQTKKLAAFEGENSLFDYLLTSEEMGVEKPSASLFQQVLKHFNMAPEQSLMIGDSHKNDIQPCLTLKIPCIQSIEFNKSEPRASTVIESLDQILDFI